MGFTRSLSILAENSNTRDWLYRYRARLSKDGSAKRERLRRPTKIYTDVGDGAYYAPSGNCRQTLRCRFEVTLGQAIHLI